MQAMFCIQSWQAAWLTPNRATCTSLDSLWDGRLFHGWNDGARTLDSVGTSGLFKGGDVALCEWPNFNADIRLDGWGWASQKLS
jgi:hypothetical protein